MNNLTPVVKNLLIINVIFYVASGIFEAQGIRLDQILGAHYFNSPQFGVWQVITYMFMHGDTMHIFVNMFSLYMFGPILENHFGQKRFFNFYFLAGIGALLLQWCFQAFELYQLTGAITIGNNEAIRELVETQKYMPSMFSMAEAKSIFSVFYTPMVGASGAIFGIMTAFAVLYPNLELMMIFIPVPIKAKYFITGYIVYELVSGLSRFQGDNTAHFAHLGGAIVGFILVKIWRNNTTYFDYYE